MRERAGAADVELREGREVEERDALAGGAVPGADSVEPGGLAVRVPDGLVAVPVRAFPAGRLPEARAAGGEPRVERRATQVAGGLRMELGPVHPVKEAERIPRSREEVFVRSARGGLREVTLGCCSSRRRSRYWISSCSPLSSRGGRSRSSARRLSILSWASSSGLGSFGTTSGSGWDVDSGFGSCPTCGVSSSAECSRGSSRRFVSQPRTRANMTCKPTRRRVAHGDSQSVPARQLRASCAPVATRTGWFLAVQSRRGLRNLPRVRLTGQR
jgi:hypothetical protein